jgi:hypothetical protein
MDESEPTITLPISTFLSILWGYKKSDLRDKAVPGKEVVALMEAVPNIQSLCYFQKQDGCETLVWQLDEWKRSGLPQEVLKAKMTKHSDDADRVYQVLKKSRVGVLGTDILRAIAHQIVHESNYIGLEALGIKREEVGL